MIEETLDKVVKYLMEHPIECSKINEDGRVNSINDEASVISKIRDVLNDDEYNEVPPRYYCDIVIDGCPVNIKVSSFGSADNVSSNQGLVYSLTGKMCSNNWENILGTLFSKENVDRKCDYYFLIVNKNNPRDVYWTSMKRLKRITPNGNNLPFQCNWGENKEHIDRNYDESFEFLVETLRESLKKRANPYNLIEKYIGE